MARLFTRRPAPGPASGPASGAATGTAELPPASVVGQDDGMTAGVEVLQG